VRGRPAAVGGSRDAGAQRGRRAHRAPGALAAQNQQQHNRLTGLLERRDAGPGQLLGIDTTQGTLLLARPLISAGSATEDTGLAQHDGTKDAEPGGTDATVCDPVTSEAYPYEVLPPGAGQLLLQYVTMRGWVWPVSDRPGRPTDVGSFFRLRAHKGTGPVVGTISCTRRTCVLHAADLQLTAARKDAHLHDEDLDFLAEAAS